MSSVAGSEFFGGSEVSRTGQRAKGEPVFSRSARRASKEDELRQAETELYIIIEVKRIKFD